MQTLLVELCLQHQPNFIATLSTHVMWSSNVHTSGLKPNGGSLDIELKIQKGWEEGGTWGEGRTV